jgi:dihydroxyacetone kinase-like protein
LVLTSKKLIELLRAASIDIINSAEYLNKLDAVMGDGEHGSNMRKCFTAVNNKLESWTELRIHEILNQTGMTLLSSGGGTATTLLGFVFMKAANWAKDLEVLDEQNIALVWKTAFESLKARSKAQLGDKTLLDALEPATIAFCKAVDEGLKLDQAIEKAAEAANLGAENTKQMIAKKGRGLYVGERGINTPDPGATSISIILEAWRKAI